MIKKILTPYEKYVIHRKEYLFSTDTPLASPFGCAITSHPIYSKKISHAKITGFKKAIQIPQKDKEDLEQRALKIHEQWNAIGPIYSLLYPIVMYINNKKYEHNHPHLSKPPHSL